MSVLNISKQQQSTLRFAVMRFVLLMLKTRKRKRKAGNRSPQRNHTSHLRNESEPSAHRFWAEGSDKRPSAQHLRPNLQPIYHYDLGVSPTGVLRLAPFGTPPMAVVDGQVSHELPSWLPRLPIGTPQAILIALVLLSLGSGLALLFLARRRSKLNV